MEPNGSPLEPPTGSSGPGAGDAPPPAEKPQGGPPPAAAAPTPPAAEPPPAMAGGPPSGPGRPGSPPPGEGGRRQGKGGRRPDRPGGGPGGGRPGGGGGGGGPGREGRGPGPGPGGRPQRQPWSKPDFLARAVESGLDKAFLDGALEFARSLGPAVGPHQVRSIFGEVLRQEMTGFDAARFLLLKPRLAFLAAQSGRTEMREMRTVLERAVEKVCAEGVPDEERAERFERFSRGLEAILAYHKFYERKQGERA
jgi:CRISPR type III-A-associated protein Csm2